MKSAYEIDKEMREAARQKMADDDRARSAEERMKRYRAESSCACGALERARLLENIEKAARQLLYFMKEGETTPYDSRSLQQALEALDTFETRKAAERAEPDVWPPEWESGALE